MYKIIGKVTMQDSLVVAVMGGIDWAAYQGGGTDEQHVAGHGDKLPVDVARAWFPGLADVPYRR